jgi:hypothetical protein
MDSPFTACSMQKLGWHCAIQSFNIALVSRNIDKLILAELLEKFQCFYDSSVATQICTYETAIKKFEMKQTQYSFMQLMNKQKLNPYNNFYRCHETGFM